MRSPGPSSVEEIATELYRLIGEHALTDLSTEDSTLAVEVHFEPLRVLALPPVDFSGGDCSIDGYYLNGVNQHRPVIVYSDQVSDERARFTIMHELGHHLLQNNGAHLLDPIDFLGGSAIGASKVEESVCHDFAGQILIPSELLGSVIGNAVLRPAHVIKLHALTNASWEAVAVRAASFTARGSVILIRDRRRVCFAAAKGLPGWHRGAALAPNGPLSKAFSHNAKGLPELYRYGLAYSERLFCDTIRVDDRLAIGVLTPQPSDGRVAALGQPDPSWKRESYCHWCGCERIVGWCGRCSGRRCRSCDRCGCSEPIMYPLCPACFLRNRIRPGSDICVDCED